LSSSTISYNSSDFKSGSYCASFNGTNQYADLKGMSTFSIGSGGFSTSFWIKIPSSQTSKQIFIAINSNTFQYFAIQTYLGQLGFVIRYNSAGGASSKLSQMLTSDSICDNVWRHFVFTISYSDPASTMNSRYTLYQNGVKLTYTNANNNQAYVVNGDNSSDKLDPATTGVQYPAATSPNFVYLGKNYGSQTFTNMLFDQFIMDDSVFDQTAVNYIYNNASNPQLFHSTGGVVASQTIASQTIASQTIASQTNNGFIGVVNDSTSYSNGSLVVNGGAGVYGNVNIGGNINVVSDASFNSKLSVSSDVSFNSRLFIRGDVSMNSRLSVLSDVSFNGNLFVGRRIGIGKNADISFSLDLSGNLNLTGNIFNNGNLFNSFDYNSDMSLNGNLTIVKKSTFNGDVSMNSKLIVASDVSFNSKLSVANTLTMTNKASIVLTDSSSNITYSDSTAQSSAYTGAGSLAGIYNNASITVDNQGKIVALSNGVYTGLPFYQASIITSTAYPDPIIFGWGNYNSWNPNVFSTFKVSLSVIYGTDYVSVYTLNCHLNIYPYRLVSSSQTSLSVQTNNLETNAINGDSSYFYVNATYAPNGRYFWAHGINSTGTLNEGYVQIIITAAGRWGFQVKNPNVGNPCVISMVVDQTNKAIGGSVSLENISAYDNHYNQGFGSFTSSGYLGLPYYQATITTSSAYPTTINLGWSNYTSWNINVFSTFKVSISVIHGTDYGSIYTLDCYINIYPRRLVSSSQTSLISQITNIDSNAINGNTSFSYIDATYAPNGRYFWAHGINSTGTMNGGYVQMVIAAGGYWGFQIKNPSPGNPYTISIMVEQTNKAIGGILTLENISSGYDYYYTQGFN
jgi:hypothetical protein